ncbi:peptide ABC transporter permease [Gluconobacter oxydans]|uniref:ABC transporter permease n=1 Tax=Gluconobacter thailandicus TaxID=257438 RepID=UPI00029973BD|nr:ABC transporter permease [Gluconobacter thailandicus]AFW00712.1 peptide ABC transporter permease [Gluconobacter oxydans H24]ANQ40595.1 peptide ABC transporter permease [Gluconobacter oxydans]
MNALLYHLIRHPRSRIGIAILGGLLLLVCVPSLITSEHPEQVNLKLLLQAPSRSHLLGTDLFGRDILARTLYGGRHTLLIGLGVIIIAFISGVTIGTVAGFKGRWIDTITMRLIDALLSFPALVLAIALAASLGPGLMSATIAISVTMTPQFARLARAQSQRLSGMLYVDAARVLGVSDGVIMIRHVVRNGLVPLLTLAPLSVGTAILQVASLGFLGLGAQPPMPEWGADIATSLDYLRVAPWTIFSAGTAIVLTVLAFNLLADGVTAYVNPRQRIANEATRP